MRNFTQYAINSGGTIVPLLIPSNMTNGTGTFNPSILNHNGRLYVCIRHCQYTLYHSELNVNEHPYGPLVYLNPENDQTLTTTNYVGELDDNLAIKYLHPVNTSAHDRTPRWTFVGLEDARLVCWDNQFYMLGVRRDTTTNGQGRMEASAITISDRSVVETSRTRIPAPAPDVSYCEKNWMPIVDQPFTFVKWSNPCEVVRYENSQTTTITLGPKPLFAWDLRGGSQVIRFGSNYLALTHETQLFSSEAGRKNAKYTHKFVLWDESFNIIKASNSFSFLDSDIEFCCGMTIYNDKLLITFGVQDNASYVLSIPSNTIDGLLHDIK